MTDETRRVPFDRQPAWATAEAYGCDMSLLEGNLRRSPAERLRGHGQALAAALALREATERRDEVLARSVEVELLRRSLPNSGLS